MKHKTGGALKEGGLRAVAPPILTALAVTGLSLGAPGSAQAKPVTTAGLASCLENGGNIEQPIGSPIAACCIDAKMDPAGVVEQGCYVCNADWTDCVWDPHYRKHQRFWQMHGIPSGQTLTPATGGQSTPLTQGITKPGGTKTTQ